MGNHTSPCPVYWFIKARGYHSRRLSQHRYRECHSPLIQGIHLLCRTEHNPRMQHKCPGRNPGSMPQICSSRKIVSMVNCKFDINAIMAENNAGGSPALLFVKFLYHQFFVTSVTKTNKTGLPLFLSSRGYLGISKSETDPHYSRKIRSGAADFSFDLTRALFYHSYKRNIFPVLSTQKYPGHRKMHSQCPGFSNS